MTGLSITDLPSAATRMSWVRHAAMVLGIGLLCWLGVALTRTSGNVATLWFANALPVTVMLRQATSRWPATIVCTALGNLGFNLLWGDGVLLAGGFALANTVEVFCASAFCRLAFVDCGPPRTWIEYGLFFCCGGVLAPTVGATLGALLVNPSFDASFLGILQVWFLADLAGMILVGTLIFRWRDLPPLLSGNARIVEAGLLIASLIGVLYMAARFPSHYYVAFLVSPLLLWGAIRFGVLGVAALATVLLVLASVLTAHDIGPVALTLAKEPLPYRMAFLQVVVAALFVPHVLAALAFEAMRRAEAGLSQANARLTEQFSSIAENIPAAVSIVDAEGRMLFANAERAKRSSRPVEQLLGRVFTDVYEPEDARRRMALVRRAFAGESVRFADEFGFPDGRRRFVEGLVIPQWTAGKVDTCVVITIDISERLELERKLQQAQQFSLIGAIAGGVTHDLGNLLTVIESNGRLLLQAAQGDQASRDRLMLILDAAQRGEQLRRRLLEMRRGRKPQPRPVDVGDLFVRIEPLLRACLGPRVELALHLDTPLFPVHADPALLESAILNIAVNAGDATPVEGRLRISLEGRDWEALDPRIRASLPPGRRYLRLAATDTGSGMDAAALARCFEPYFTTKQRPDRSGLGLASIKWSVEQCGGAVTIDSAVGRGTTVCLYLPETNGAGAARAAGA